MSFTLLKKLPAELRVWIWRLSLPEDESEVCAAWEGGPIGTPFNVDTGFPVAMHVCFESRAVALASGIEFRECEAARCPVPCRPFDPALDILYWGQENHRLALLQAFAGYLMKVQHMAIDIEMAGSPSSFMPFLRKLVERCMRWVPDISLVLPDAKLELAPEQRRPARRPSSRFKLVRLDKQGPGLVRIAASIVLGSRFKTWFPDMLWPLTGSLTERDGWKEGTTVRPRLRSDMLMFVEYQKEGTWKECCADWAYKCDERRRRLLAETATNPETSRERR